MAGPPWLRLAILAALLCLVLVAVFSFHLQDSIGPVLEWIDEHPQGGAAAFVAIYALATVLFLPGLLLSLGGGAIFGAALGCLVVWAGAVLGETLAFLFGRLLLRDWLKTLTSKYPVWEAVDIAVSEEGWQMVLLLRLAPVVPFAALNYAMGATSVGLWPYTWASALGILPGVAAFVYAGSLAGGLGEVLAGRARPPPGLAIAGAAASVVAIFATGALITVHARRIIKRRLDRARPHDSGSAAPVDDEAGLAEPARRLHLNDETPQAPLLH